MYAFPAITLFLLHSHVHSFVKYMTINDTPDCYPGCGCMLDAMHCNVTVPTYIPNKITKVTLTGVPEFTYLKDNSPFSDISWTKVSFLSISCNDTANAQIHGNVFSTCGNLKHLAFTAKLLDKIENNSFAGLGKLEILELPDCFHLKLTALTGAIRQRNVLPRLKYLNLKNLAILSRENPYFDSIFLDALKYKNIQRLDLSGIPLGTMDTASFPVSLPNLRSVNFEMSVHLSIDLLLAYFYKSNGESFQNLECLNFNLARISRSILEKVKVMHIIDRYNISSLTPLATNELRIKGMVYSDVHVEFEVLEDDIRICPVIFITDIPVKIPTMCLRKLDKHNSQPSLLVFDVAENGVENVDPRFYPYAQQVRFVNCSYNRLTSLIPKELMHHTKTAALEELHCSNNFISDLPYSLVSLVPNLTVVDLSFNLLDTIPSDLANLTFLKMLDVSYNKIQFLDSKTTSLFDNLLKTYSMEKRLNNFQLKLVGNPLMCNCDDASLNFIDWLKNTKVISSSQRLRLACSFKDKTFHIDNDVLDKVVSQCQIPKLIVIFSVSGILFLALVIIVLWRIIRYKQKRNKTAILKKLIENYKNEDNNDKLTVFLSYSSTDADFVMDNIFTNLNERLQNILETNQTCVATGDFNFRLGFPITNEIIRCIDASAVIVFCVSAEFCNSRYCEDEVVVACYDRKPIVLMFLEKIDINEMPKVLMKPFQNITRSKWILNERGHYEIIPKWEVVCRSIVDLMVSKV